MSSPKSRTLGSLSSITSIASRIASIIVISRMSVAQFLPLAAQVIGKVGIDAAKHFRRRAGPRIDEGTVRFHLALDRAHFLQDLCLLLRMLRVGPSPLPDQIALQPVDGIAERPGAGLV